MVDSLLSFLVWIFGIQFALRAAQEHRNLRLKNSQLCLEHGESGCEFLQYTEDIFKYPPCTARIHTSKTNQYPPCTARIHNSKTNNGGLSICVSKGKLFVRIKI